MTLPFAVSREMADPTDLAAAKRNRLIDLWDGAYGHEFSQVNGSSSAMALFLCLQAGVDDIRRRLAKASKGGGMAEIREALGDASNTADRVAKSNMIVQWIVAIWIDYMQRCAAVERAATVADVATVSSDFSGHGPVPYSIRDFLADFVSGTIGGAG